jgi:hypothetical protein
MDLTQRLKLGVSAVVITSISYWMLSNRGGLELLLAALQVIGGVQFAAGCAVCAATLLVRFARWQAIPSRMGHRLGRLFSLRVCLAGIALAWTPAKLGETLRSLLLLPAGVPWSQRVRTFVASGRQARREERRDRNVLQVREDHEHPTNDAWRPRSKKFSPSQSAGAFGADRLADAIGVALLGLGALTSFSRHLLTDARLQKEEAPG